MPNKHLIGRQKFKIRVTNRADADFIYASISELVKGQLTREIEKVLNERYDEQTTIIRIDRLVLELGTLDRPQFAQRLIEEVTNQLRAALPEVPSPDQKISPELSALELVDFYLARGYFPWQYQQQSGRGLPGLIEQLLADAPDRLLGLLQLRLKKLVNQKRLAYQLPEKTFSQLNQRVWAAEWPSIKDRMHAIVAKHQSDLTERGYAPSLFKKIGYLAALMAGLAPSNARVSPREKFELLFAKHFGAFFKLSIEAKSSTTPPRQAVLANFIQFLKSGDTDSLKKARSYDKTTVSSLLKEEAPSLMRFLRLLPNEEQDFIEAVLNRMSTVLEIDLIVATFLRLGYLTDASVVAVSELARQLKFNAAKLTEDQQQSTDRHETNDSRDKEKMRGTAPSRSAKGKAPDEASQTGPDQPSKSSSEHLESDAQTSATAESDQKKGKDKSKAQWEDNRKYQLLFSFLRAFLLNQEPELSRGEMEEAQKLFTKQAPKHSSLIDRFFFQLGQRDTKELLSAVERILRQFGSQPIQLYLKRSGLRDLAAESRPESLTKAIVLARQSAKKAGETDIDFFETPAKSRKPAASSDSASDAKKDEVSTTNSPADERERRRAVVLNYLSTGRLSWEKQQYTHSAVLRWLEQMLDNQDRIFFKRLLKELKQARTNTFMHQQLDWPLLLKLQRWLWKEISDQPFDYDEDLQFLLGKLNLSTYSIDLIRRDAFRHWTKARLLSENGSLAWSALFPAIFSRAAREKGQDDEQFLLAINRIVEATGADKWASDLPEIIKSLTAPLLNEFSATRNPGAIALLRFYLQNGYLPASATSKKLAEIEDDLRLRIQQREPTLLVTLGQMLQSSTASNRFQSGLSLGLQFELAAWLVETATSSRTAKTGEHTAETDRAATDSSTEASEQQSEQAGALASSEASIYWPTFLAELPNWVRLLRPPADQNESNTTTSTEQSDRRSENDLLAKGYTFICLAILVKGMAKSSAVEILLAWIKSTGNKYAFQLSDPGLPPESSTTPPEAQATDTLQPGDQLSVPPANPSVEWATYARHLLHRRAVKKTATIATEFTPATRLALEQIARLAPDDPAAASSQLSEVSPATLKTSPQTSGKIKSAPDKETKKSALLQAYWLTLFNTGKSLDPDSSGVAGELSDELGEPLDGMRELLDAPSAVWQQWLGQLSGSSAQVNRIDDLLTTELARRFKERILLDFNPATKTLLEELALLLRRVDLYPSPEAARRRVRFHAISYILSQPEATYDKLTATLLLRLSREKQLSLRELAEKVSPYLAENGLKTTELTTTLLLESRRIEAAEKAVIQQKNDRFIEEIKQLSKSELAATRGRELLLHLLQSGTTPWWEEEQETIDFHFRTASQNDAPEMGRLLEKSPKLLDKLLPFLATSSLEDFAAKLFPAYGDFIRAYLLSAGLLHRELNRSFDWSAFLSAIMKLRSFDSDHFVRSEVKRLAPLASEALVREQLLGISRAQSAKGDLRFFRLSTILSELAGSAAEGEAAAATALASKSPKTPRAPQPPQKPPAIETDEAALVNTPSAAARELDARLELIRHFLVYGTVPTDADKHWSRTALQELQEQFINNYPEIASSLYRRLLRLSYVRSRVIRHFTPSFWSDLIGLLMGQKAARDVYLIWDDLWQLSPEWLPKKSGQFDKKELRIHLLTYAAAGPAAFSQVDYLLKLLQLIAARLNLREEEIFVALREKVALRADELKLDWQLLLDNYQRRKTQEQMDSDEIEVDELNDAIFISNSGLVILAPFLPRYFDMLGMVKDRAFVDEQAAIRAVQLLQYLVSGQSETEEYLLVLNKVLCGLPISTPIPSSVELSEQELETSRQLLNAVLQNWDKMSNSSVDNLRGSFLLRDGRLDESDDKWQLIVESAGYDVILSFLPWTISVISLPWMEKQLYVDWSTQIS